MYVVDLSLWILVSWIGIICGSLCSVRLSSCMHGRLELMQLAFQVIVFRVELRCMSVFVLIVGVWIGSCHICGRVVSSHD